MITLKILGGLGNQLYAFACGYSVAKSLNQELVLDVADYYNGYTHPYALDALNIPVCRKLTYTHASEKMLTPDVIPVQIKDTFDVIADFADGITDRETLLQRIGTHRNIYLNGYWASHDFFSGDEDDIRRIFSPLHKSGEYRSFLETIRGQCSIAVHMRRTDFVALGNVCSDDYYKAAIVYMQSLYPDAMFYFFSDDIDYARQQFGNQRRFRYIQIFGGMNANLDEFFCISACNHRILHKGSSFSEWASFLSSNPDKKDIVYVPRDGQSPKGFVCLNDRQIADLKENYQTTPRFTIQNNIEARTSIDRMLTKGQYETILDVIADISMDAYSVSRADCIYFLADKAVAYAQTDQLLAAEQCLHKQAQYSRDDENFHANYYVVLKALGKSRAASIHAARCANLTQSEALRMELNKSFTDDSPESRIYGVIRNTPLKHFIVTPNTPWFYYIKTPQSIAAWLARMGHTVSYIFPPSVKNIDPAPSPEQVVDACLKAKSGCDTLYSYGLDLFPSIINKTATGQLIPYVEPLIKHLSRSGAGEPVVVFRHPHAVGDNRERKYARFLYWDFQDDADSERTLVNAWSEDMREYMCRQADRVIVTNRTLFEKTRAVWQLNNVYLFEHQDDVDAQPCRYLEERIPYSSNCLADDRTIELAAFILGLSNE